VISFRYHIVSLLAVLLALAAGVALGGGPLSDLGRGGDDATERAEARTQDLSRQLDEAGLTDSFQDEFAQDLSAGAVSGSLTNRPVVLITMPGADEKVVSSLSDLVGEASGSVSGTYAVQQTLVSEDEKSLVDTLGSQLVGQPEGKDVAASAPTYERMGQLIGRAVATVNDAGAAADTSAKDLLSSLKGADLLTQEEGEGTRGNLVIVVLGDEPANPDESDNIFGGLMIGLAEQSDGVVLAGTTGSGNDGLMAVLRDDVAFSANVSTADSTDTTAGRIAAVLGLAADGAGTTGHYGAFGIDGALPRG
jgi:hypothetical protein